MHGQNEEAFYVLDGEVTVGLGDRTSKAPVGSFVFVPRGLVHSLRSEAGTPTSLLMIIMPAGMEQMYEELAHVFSASDGRPIPPTSRRCGRSSPRGTRPRRRSGPSGLPSPHLSNGA